MRRRRKYRRLIAAATAAGLLAAPPAFARTTDHGVRSPGPAPTTRPLPSPNGGGPQAWLLLFGLTGCAIAAGGTAGAPSRRLA